MLAPHYIKPLTHTHTHARARARACNTVRYSDAVTKHTLFTHRPLPQIIANTSKRIYTHKSYISNARTTLHHTSNH